MNKEIDTSGMQEIEAHRGKYYVDDNGTWHYSSNPRGGEIESSGDPTVHVKSIRSSAANDYLQDEGYDPLDGDELECLNEKIAEMVEVYCMDYEPVDQPRTAITVIPDTEVWANQLDGLIDRIPGRDLFRAASRGHRQHRFRVDKQGDEFVYEVTLED